MPRPRPPNLSSFFASSPLSSPRRICRPPSRLPPRRNQSTLRPDILPLSHFIASPSAIPSSTPHDPAPYLPAPTPQTYHLERYGCQMNFADADLINSILQSSHFHPTSPTSADVILLVTCAIRDDAEQRIWRRLRDLQPLRARGGKIALLGCMAERLKHRLLEGERLVDVVCGPDAYRDLPSLLGEGGVNVMLSVDETYADIMPVQIDQGRKSAFVSIMRGCNNMCTYCIVPFTRGTHTRNNYPFSTSMSNSICLRMMANLRS